MQTEERQAVQKSVNARLEFLTHYMSHGREGNPAEAMKGLDIIFRGIRADVARLSELEKVARPKIRKVVRRRQRRSPSSSQLRRTAGYRGGAK